jgi:hypothetical protein
MKIALSGYEDSDLQHNEKSFIFLCHVTESEKSIYKKKMGIEW